MIWPQAGNIYIADYHLMDGIKPNDTDPLTQQFLVAPICLLYKDLENKIMPIAIQVIHLHMVSVTAFYLNILNCFSAYHFSNGLSS